MSGYASERPLCHGSSFCRLCAEGSVNRYLYESWFLRMSHHGASVSSRSLSKGTSLAHWMFSAVLKEQPFMPM